MVKIDKTKILRLTDEETHPGMILIIKSGWKDMYHIISEDPENGDYDHTHEFLSHDQIITKFKIDPTSYPDPIDE